MNSLSMARYFSRLHPPLLCNERACLSPSLLKFASVRRSLFLDVNTAISVRCAITSSTASNTGRSDEAKMEKVALACPVCYQQVISSSSRESNLLTVKGISLRCKNCQKTFKTDGGIIDLTIPNDGVISLGSSFFQIPFIAYVYERGYRDAFGVLNFPGFAEEAKMAQNLLEPARGEVILDLSCGPGGFTRRFLVGGDYKMVIAADFSLAMLEQCRGFLENDASADLSKVVLVRADAARLPFVTSSLAGVHAAAAIHCWPDIFTSVAEVSRVLRPGGIFVASTFLLPTPRGLEEILKPFRKAIDQLQLQFAWFTEAELQATVEACGLINWYSYRRGSYILFSATKPV